VIGDENGHDDDTTTPQREAIRDDDLAVALSYMPGMDQAPRVVAQGQGWLAQHIIEVAKANGIEIRQDANLAEILAQVDVDSEIPLEAFTVVAEILSYIYEKNRDWPDGLTPNTKAQG
jgi:flagellar biosynthesis protein